VHLLVCVFMVLIPIRFDYNSRRWRYLSLRLHYSKSTKVQL